MTERAYAAVAALAIALGVVLNLPALGAGLVADDYLQRAMLDGSYPVQRSPLDLYNFVDDEDELARLIAAGTLPWWSDPKLGLSALRPLSSLTIVLDERVLGLGPRAQHVHSFVWFGLLLVAFAALAQRVAPRGPAALALVLFAIDPAHVLPIAWLANRTALISATFGVFALWAQIRFRRDGFRPGALLATLGFSLALAAGEYALSIIVYLVVYELIAGGGSLASRLWATSTGVVPALLYLCTHLALGYGATGSAVYVDPIATPLKFVLGSLLRVPALAASELTVVPPEALHGGSIAGGILAWLALLIALSALLALVPGALRRVDPEYRRLLLAFGLGALLSLVPLAGTMPSARLLLVPSVGGSLILALVFWDAAAGMRSAERRRTLGAKLRMLVMLPLGLAHFLVAPLGTLGAELGWRGLHARVHRIYLDAPSAAFPAAATVVLVNAVEPQSLIYPPYVRAAHGLPMPKIWRVLSITHRPERLERVSSDTLELTIEGGGMLEDPVSQLFRALEHPLAAGDVARLPDVTIEVLELAEWGPKRVRYRFAQSLDDPTLALLVIERGALRRLPPPSIGQTIVIQPR